MQTTDSMMMTTALLEPSLEQTIERQVTLRTWGRIHRLRVDRAGGRLVVHGRTATYYDKQLALQGVLDVLGSADGSEVELNIEVSAGGVRATRLH